MASSLPTELIWLISSKVPDDYFKDRKVNTTMDKTELLNSILDEEGDMEESSQIINRLSASMADLDQDSDQAKQSWYRQAHAIKMQIVEIAGSIETSNQHIENIASKAETSEALVVDMTKDIKSLDTGKRQITWSMTSLKRLQMLVTAVDQLDNLVRAKNYKETAGVLQAVIQLVSYFDAFKSIEAIDQLARSVEGFKSDLFDQIRLEFNTSFNSEGVLISRQNNLHDACLVAEMMGEEPKQRLISIFCDKQSFQYSRIFNPASEAGQLDNLSRRLAWLKRALRLYDEEHSSLFPKTWRMDHCLAGTFCKLTREHLIIILSKSNLDAKELIIALHAILDVESFLVLRFGDKPVLQAKRKSDIAESIDTVLTVSSAFKPYLGVYITSQDKVLCEMIEKFKADTSSKDDEDTNVYSSSSALFLHYRQVFTEFERFSTGQALVDLCNLFRKHLKSYSEKVLLSKLGEAKNAEKGAASAVINTADYCLRTIQQLEQRAKDTVEENLVISISFEQEKEAFSEVVATGIRVLVKSLETDWHSSFEMMNRVAWQSMQTVGDTQSYVKVFQETSISMANSVKSSISNSRYLRIFCDKMVETFAAKYISNLSLCKPISPVAAEQMLLDLSAIKMTLNSMLQIVNDLESIPTAHTRHITRTFLKIEGLLKLIMTSTEPADVFVHNFGILLGDESPVDMQSVLDLKGLKRAEQTKTIDLWKKDVKTIAPKQNDSDARPANKIKSSRAQTGGGYLSLKPALGLNFSTGSLFGRQGGAHEK